MPRVQLSQSEAETLRRSIKGQGGMQSLLRKLQTRIAPDLTVAVSETELGQIRRYVLRYGGGGFQERLRPLLKPEPQTKPDSLDSW